MAQRRSDGVETDDRLGTGTVDSGIDVVVVGFGAAGAAAALAAARAGARVLVLDRRTLVPLPSTTARRNAVSSLRARARAAGVELRRCSTVGELLVEGGAIAGVGFTEVDPCTGPGARHWWLERLGRWVDRLPERSAGVLRSRTEASWLAAAAVGQVRAPAVVLGLDRRYWDFVGPAVWAAGLARPAAARPALRRHLGLAPEGSTAASAELRSRSWCTRTTGAGDLVDAGRELEVDLTTGRVRSAAGVTVAGLYAAVPAGGPGRADLARTAGCAAAARRGRQPALRSAG